MRERPTGVTILAILAAIGGVLYLLGALAFLGFSAVGGAAGGGALAGLGMISGVILLALGAAYLALAYGFWKLLPWAWMLGVALAIISLAWTAIEVVTSPNMVAALTGSIIGIAISVVILYYLFQPHVKAAFGRP